MTSELEQLLSQWLIIIGQPKILIPLFGGIGLGLLMSLFPYIRNMKRHSDRAFYVYLTNAVGSGSLFILTQRDQPLEAVLSMLILVCSSSVIIPWLWFNVYNRRKQ